MSSDSLEGHLGQEMPVEVDSAAKWASQGCRHRPLPKPSGRCAWQRHQQLRQQPRPWQQRWSPAGRRAWQRHHREPPKPPRQRPRCKPDEPILLCPEAQQAEGWDEQEVMASGWPQDLTPSLRPKQPEGRSGRGQSYRRGEQVRRHPPHRNDQAQPYYRRREQQYWSSLPPILSGRVPVAPYVRGPEPP